MKLLVETFWAAGKVVAGAAAAGVCGGGKAGGWVQAARGCAQPSAWSMQGKQLLAFTPRRRMTCPPTPSPSHAAVCHGPAALTTAVGPDSQPIVKGRQVCCTGAALLQ